MDPNITLNFFNLQSKERYCRQQSLPILPDEWKQRTTWDHASTVIAFIDIESHPPINNLLFDYGGKRGLRILSFTYKEVNYSAMDFTVIEYLPLLPPYLFALDRGIRACGGVFCIHAKVTINPHLINKNIVAIFIYNIDKLEYIAINIPADPKMDNNESINLMLTTTNVLEILNRPISPPNEKDLEGIKEEDRIYPHHPSFWNELDLYLVNCTSHIGLNQGMATWLLDNKRKYLNAGRDFNDNLVVGERKYPISNFKFVA
jgi:hypothetical protein